MNFIVIYLFQYNCYLIMSILDYLIMLLFLDYLLMLFMNYSLMLYLYCYL